MGSRLALQFWGTRGWVSNPSPDTSIFGGNTSSIQILNGDEIVLVDTGFGVSNLGEQLMMDIIKHKRELTIHILYTHFHWDHIQGLPFFHPIYFPESTLNIYSPGDPTNTLRQLDILFDGSYSPFEGIKSMPSTVAFHSLDSKSTIAGLEVTHHQLDHFHNDGLKPYEKTYGYRFQSAEDSISIVLDHEARPGAMNESVISFFRGSGLLVHDAHYSDVEYADYQGWGHSSFSQAMANAVQGNVGRVLLAHHAPSRTDGELMREQDRLRQRSEFSSVDLAFAREGVVYSVP